MASPHSKLFKTDIGFGGIWNVFSNETGDRGSCSCSPTQQIFCLVTRCLGRLKACYQGFFYRNATIWQSNVSMESPTTFMSNFHCKLLKLGCAMTGGVWAAEFFFYPLGFPFANLCHFLTHLCRCEFVIHMLVTSSKLLQHVDNVASRASRAASKLLQNVISVAKTVSCKLLQNVINVAPRAASKLLQNVISVAKRVSCKLLQNVINVAPRASSKILQHVINVAPRASSKILHHAINVASRASSKLLQHVINVASRASSKLLQHDINAASRASSKLLQHVINVAARTWS